MKSLKISPNIRAISCNLSHSPSRTAPVHTPHPCFHHISTDRHPSFIPLRSKCPKLWNYLNLPRLITPATLWTLSPCLSAPSCLHCCYATFLRKPTPNNSQLYVPNECTNHLYLPRLATSALDKSKARHWRSSLPGCKNLHLKIYFFYTSTRLHPHISPSYCTLYRLCKFSAFVDHVSTT